MLVKLADKNCVKKDFECGKELLDNYIKTQASQDIKKDLSACYVYVDDENIVRGYYTLSASSIKKEDLSREFNKNLPPSYEAFPTILLGRLAIDKSIQGRGQGEYLLIDALRRALKISEELGSLAVTVDPIDEDAEKFYRAYGFIKFPDQEKMFLLTKTIKNSYGN